MRKQEELRTVPIIALSGHVEPEFQAEALSAGCNGYLMKPLNFTQLRETLGQLLPVYSDVA